MNVMLRVCALEGITENTRNRDLLSAPYAMGSFSHCCANFSDSNSRGQECGDKVDI